MRQNQQRTARSKEKRVVFNSGHLEFKLHPVWALAGFIIFLITIVGGVYSILESNYKSRLENKEDDIEKLNSIVKDYNEKIQTLQKDTAAFNSLKIRLRSTDTTGISPKELIIIDSLSQISLKKELELKNNYNQIMSLQKETQQLKANQNVVNKQQPFDKNAGIHTVTEIIHDTIKLVDTVYQESQSYRPYFNESGTLDNSQGFQDPSGFSLGILNWSHKQGNVIVDVTILKPGETESKVYKSISVGTSWTGSANDIKYMMTITDFYWYGSTIGYRVKVAEIPK